MVDHGVESERSRLNGRMDAIKWMMNGNAIAVAAW